MNGWDHARGGPLVGLAFGLAAGTLVLALPSPTNVVVLRVLGSPFLFVVAFGDGAIWSHVLAFRLSPHAGPVLWICGASYAELAPGFDDFWERYLANPDTMLWPTAEQVISPGG